MNGDELTLPQAFERAVAYHREGQLAEAEILYRRILAAAPDDPDTTHMLGLLAHQCGHSEQGADLIGRALSGNDNGHYWSNLAAVLMALSRHDEAETACVNALALEPDIAEAHLNLAILLERRQQRSQAVEHYRRAAALGSGADTLWFRLGRCLFHLDRHAEALECLDTAMAKGRDDGDLRFIRGRVLHELRRYPEAVEDYRAVLDVNPAHADAALHLGLIYQETNRFDLAETMLKWAADLAPSNPYVAYNLSRLLKTLGRITAAIRAAEKAIALKPDFALAYQALGNAYHGGGQMEAAIEAFRQGSALAPDDYGLHHNIIACMRTDWRTQGVQIRDAYRDWNARHLGAIKAMAHANSPDPDRRLRIGYVSPDYRNHAVAYFLEPQLAAHDRQRVEVFCYSQVEEGDEITERFRALADHWRDIARLGDDETAALIQQDGIDILVDCAGHTVGMRMHVFARKPAPVQVTTLIGHDTTTGVAAIDYILSDSYLTPPGYDDHFTETVIRLPRVVAPFLPRDDWAPVPPLPEDGPVLFGCFAEPTRIGELSLDLWRRILDRVPGSRLLLKHKSYGFPDQARYWRERFAALGDAFDLEGVPGGWSVNMTVYERVSLVLDSFPLTGATSSLIPLWMGVPVVTLAGHHSGQRYGVTMLTNAGVPELVAADPGSYVDLAASLATDRPRLQEYRVQLRDRLRSSPILDAVAVTRDVEDAYIRMWRSWCEAGQERGDGDGR